MQVELTMPQLLFNVSSGDVTQTWQFRKPAGYDLDSTFLKGQSGALTEEQQGSKIDHWRNVIRQKLTRVLANTAKAAGESGAVFCIDPSGYDAIGCYLAAGCTKGNTLLSIAHGQSESGTYHWYDDVIDQLKAPDGVEEMDKELGVVVNRKETVEFNDPWMDGDRLKYTSAELGAACEAAGLDRDAYMHHPSSAPTHYIVCESPVGKKIVEDILTKSIMSGEFIINGSFVGTAKRVANALQAERPLFIFQHTGGCADLASVLFDQVKLVQRMFHNQQNQPAQKDKAGREKPKPRLEDLMSMKLPFDPFQAENPEYVLHLDAEAGRPRIEFTGVVGNVEKKSQYELMTHLNACFANFPSGVSPDARLVIDPFVQRGAALQDMISRTMVSAGGGNKDELNGEFADIKRLHLAWEMHGALTYAAEKQQKIAVIMQALIMVLSFATLAIAQIRSNAAWFFPALFDTLAAASVADGTARMLSEANATDTTPTDAVCSSDGENQNIICQASEYGAIVIPALVTLLITVRGRLDPDSKVLELKSGAARIETEIYKFRTRTGHYGRAALAGGGSEDGAEDGAGAGTGAMTARKKFEMTITAIWDGLLKSVVTEGSSEFAYMATRHVLVQPRMCADCPCALQLTSSLSDCSSFQCLHGSQTTITRQG